MIGIYKITNLINGKSYIGQSNNIIRRFSEHKNKGARADTPIDLAISKIGKDNFHYEVIEETTVENLNKKETYWILFYQTHKNGYNCSVGGDNQSVGINNGRSIMTEKDIVEIRLAYAARKRRKEVYESYKDKIAFGTFASIWDGSQWSHIMPEVFTEENKLFYSRQASDGELSSRALFTNQEVISLRQQYVTKTAKEIFQEVKNKCSFQTLQQLLWGKTYTMLPIYKKKEKQWINN